MRLLSLCLSLAAGEFLASLVRPAAAAWPVAAGVAVLVLLFGYGFAVRGWPFAFVLFAGAALFFAAAMREERCFRDRPWMRGCERFLKGGRPADAPLARRLRRDLSRRLSLGVAPEGGTASLSRAILLGERSRLSPEMRRTFVESGTIHVFAISGLHVMAIADVLAVVLAVLFVPRRFAGVVTVPFLWGYVWLIGCPPSAVRAALMTTVSCGAALAWRRPNGLRAWAITFLLVHLCRPLLLVEVGNALSFAVMLAIVLAGELGKDLPRTICALWTTFAAWAAGVPIAAHVFGRLTPGGLLANLVLIETARVSVVSGAVGVALGFVSSALAAHFNNLSALGIRLMTTVADGVSRLPGANFETGRWPLSACALWYAGLVLAGWMLFRGLRRRHLL